MKDPKPSTLVWYVRSCFTPKFPLQIQTTDSLHKYLCPLLQVETSNGENKKCPMKFWRNELLVPG
jgi:hypothetical protein